MYLITKFVLNTTHPKTNFLYFNKSFIEVRVPIKSSTVCLANWCIDSFLSTVKCPLAFKSNITKTKLEPWEINPTALQLLQTCQDSSQRLFELLGSWLALQTRI
jgi:hypothetical protein